MCRSDISSRGRAAIEASMVAIPGDAPSPRECLAVAQLSDATAGHCRHHEYHKIPESQSRICSFRGRGDHPRLSHLPGRANSVASSHTHGDAAQLSSASDPSLDHISHGWLSVSCATRALWMPPPTLDRLCQAIDPRNSTPPLGIKKLSPHVALYSRASAASIQTHAGAAGTEPKPYAISLSDELLGPCGRSEAYGDGQSTLSFIDTNEPS
jgi:hypothetical protein